jgi:uncharacterized membrane protein
LKLFARGIATSFLFLVGYSLVLAARNDINTRSFLKRLAQLIAAGLAITLVTRIMTPETYVFFGILQHIAVASILGLAFVRAPVAVTLISAVTLLVLPFVFRADLFGHPGLLWIGLSTAVPSSSDYVPLLPWFAAVLAGIATARLTASGLPIHSPKSRPTKALAWLGRHSLAFYLIHQPVLFGLVAGAALIAPPAISQARIDGFVADCRTGCAQSRDGEFCVRYCDCFLDELRASDALDTLFRHPDVLEASGRIDAIVNQCSVSSEEAKP